MAETSYRSSSTNTTTASNTVAVTKPAGLAVGDTMIAPVGLYHGGVAGTDIVPPAGWTSLGAHTNSNGTLAAFWKVADANDVAASSFTFTATGTGTADGMAAGIAAFSSTSPTAPIDQSITADDAGVTGITPTVGMGLYVMAFAAISTTGTTGSIASYAIANNNPTWTEVFDIGVAISGADRVGVSLAYGGNSRLSASGAGSATVTGYNNYKTFLLDVVPALVPPLVASSTLPIPSLRYSAATMATVPALGVPTYVERPWKASNTTKHNAAVTNLTKS